MLRCDLLYLKPLDPGSADRGPGTLRHLAGILGLRVHFMNALAKQNTTINEGGGPGVPPLTRGESLAKL
jgi:hypothetical protein